MASEETMTIHERHKYLRIKQKQYKQANKTGKQQLLSEMETVTGLHRKSLIRLMNSAIQKKERRKQRGPTYGPDIQYALEVISHSHDHICAERLQPNLIRMAEHLHAHEELELTPSMLGKLETISVSTVRRMLQKAPEKTRHRPRKQPKQRNQLSRAIPARRIPWDEKVPGHFEVDMVWHSGAAASGEFVHSLQMIDVTTGWSERVATLGRSYRVMEDGFKRILTRLPFPVKEIHPDNGSEFLNNHLVRFWKEVARGAELSRSRPWQKNDNRFVEQKNDSLIRAYFGNERLDTVDQTNLLNHIYDRMWLFYNFFQPVMRLKEKIVTPVPGSHSKTKRIFDVSKTPFDRLCEAGVFSPAQIEELETIRQATNTRQLIDEIYALIDRLFALPNARKGVPENVHDTLLYPFRLREEEVSSVTLSND